MNRQPPFDVGSRTILGITPLQLPRSEERGTWTCTRCGSGFPVSRSHAVEFDSKGRRLRFVVCPECAVAYDVPRPVVLDLTRLPSPDRAERELKMLAAHAWFVSNARHPLPDDVIVLRDADVRRLAERHGQTPATYIDRLRDRGVLAG